MPTELTPKPEPGVNVIRPISAAPSASQLTAAARKTRYDELRQRMGRSRLAVEGVKGRHYLWAFKSDSSEMDRLDYLGYRITREANAKDVLVGKAEPKIRANGLREDGTYVLGDVMLVDCDQEVYEFLMLDNEEKSNAQRSAAKDNFVFEAEKKGVPTFEVDKSKNL
jgi:hypothetical protein